MKNWQKNRNYKRVKDKDGNVVANIIIVYMDRMLEVSDEVFASIFADGPAVQRYVGEDCFWQNVKFRWEQHEGRRYTYRNAGKRENRQRRGNLSWNMKNAKMRAEQVKHLPIVLASV